MIFLAKLEAHSLCDSKQYRYTIYTTKSSNNAPWYDLSTKGVAYRVSVFSLNVSKPADLQNCNQIHSQKATFSKVFCEGMPPNP